MTVLYVPLNVADRKAISEGATLTVATSEIVKPIPKRLVGIAAVVTRESRITKTK